MVHCTPDIDKLIEGFPYSSLTKIEGRPTKSTIEKIIDELRANCGDTHCPLGGGLNGYIGITMTIAEYQAILPVQWVTPVHPRQPPNPVGVGATAHCNANAIYQNNLNQCMDYTNMQTACKKLLCEAVNKQHCKTIKEPIHQCN